MADSSSASTDATISRRSPRDEQVSKKQKTSLATFSVSDKDNGIWLTSTSDPKSLVTFLIGPDPTPTEFLIHKEVVCLQSAVLSAAFNSPFTEGQTQTYRLTDTTERAFRLFMQWLYSQKLTASQLDPDLDLLEVRFEKLKPENDEDMSLVEVWVLADKFGMPSLQNAALDSIHQIFVRFDTFPTKTFDYIFKNTGAGSPIREYTIKLCREHLTTREFAFYLPPDLVLGLLERFFEEVKNEDPVEFPVSDFYVQ